MSPRCKRHVQRATETRLPIAGTYQPSGKRSLHERHIRRHQRSGVHLQRVYEQDPGLVHRHPRLQLAKYRHAHSGSIPGTKRLHPDGT